MNANLHRWVFGFLAAGALLPHPSLAQNNPCAEPDFIQVWVDPFDGTDGGQLPDDPQQPFLTINAAIQRVNTALSDPAEIREQGIVHCLPGVYTDFGSVDQNFPVTMLPNIHVQGAGAKECVLRVREADTRLVLWPLSSGLIRRQTTVAVDFSSCLQEGGEPSMFDGFTIQGAEVQVYLGGEIQTVWGRVSNCVFDMRDGGKEDLSGPYFGVLVDAIYFGKEVQYQDHDLRLFNNTFVQGVLTGEDIEVARAENVAIANCCHPDPGLYVDPIQVVRGVNDLHIQNNLIRCLDDEPRTAMLGIDRGDTQVVVSSRGAAPYDTNAFDGTLVGGTSVDGTFFSDVWDSVQGFAVSPPRPVVDLGPEDPGFVGEYLTQLQGVYIRDARILPDSVVVDRGATPAWTGDLCSSGDFVAGNGRVHSDSRTADVISSFDYDGDGHGNERVVGEDIDIGFDEFGQVVLAGSYGNDTKSHHLSYDPQDYGAGGPRVDSAGVRLVQDGTGERDYIFPGPTGFWLTAQSFNFDTWRATAGTEEDVWTVTGGYTHMPGSVAFPVNELVPGSGPLPLTTWIDFLGVFTMIPALHPASLVGPVFSSPDSWTNPESGQMHSFERFRWSAPETTVPPAPPEFFTSDLQIFDGSQLVRSNLLAEYL